MLKWLKRALLIFVLALFLFIAIFFAIRNGQPVSIDLVLWQGPELSVALYMIISLALGILIAVGLSSVLLFRLEQQARRLRKKMAKQQAELDSLRKASLSTELTERE
ncbi:LapA family protein [Marinomonas piezotolerans]|uniref:LapA family protein n=1 Tax=Marinomonas piezotolerans TaxID=2213058 RepID=A0A370U6Q3_9GAMM|nr:LapA family protein [Marinomonas piezotolerans]RDL43433.1 LapA family protein [Marinomonas piezotolerans]